MKKLTILITFLLCIFGVVLSNNHKVSADTGCYDLPDGSQPQWCAD